MYVTATFLTGGFTGTYLRLSAIASQSVHHASLQDCVLETTEDDVSLKKPLLKIGSTERETSSHPCRDQCGQSNTICRGINPNPRATLITDIQCTRDVDTAVRTVPGLEGGHYDSVPQNALLLQYHVVCSHIVGKPREEWLNNVDVGWSSYSSYARWRARTSFPRCPGARLRTGLAQSPLLFIPKWFMQPRSYFQYFTTLYSEGASTAQTSDKIRAANFRDRGVKPNYWTYPANHGAGWRKRVPATTDREKLPLYIEFGFQYLECCTE